MRNLPFISLLDQRGSQATFRINYDARGYYYYSYKLYQEIPKVGALLRRDRQGYHKVYRAVQIAEQEFDFNLSHLAYSNVLRACSLHDSKESAEFALKIVKGFGVSQRT